MTELQNVQILNPKDDMTQPEKKFPSGATFFIKRPLWERNSVTWDGFSLSMQLMTPLQLLQTQFQWYLPFSDVCLELSTHTSSLNIAAFFFLGPQT